MDLDTVADELYAGPLADFVATRTSREKEAKAAGDRELAARIHALAKPNQVAWLANQLARGHGDELAPLLALGAELRDATDSLTGDQLREFSRQQHVLVHALVEQAKRLAPGGGRVSDDTTRALQETLRAALADPEAAERLTGARLVEGMQHVGFGPGVGGLTTASARPKAAATSDLRKAAGSPPDGAHVRSPRDQRAELELQRAQERAQEAAETLDEARSELDRSEADLARLEDEVIRLRDDLESAEAQQAQGARDHRRVKAAFDRADEGARDAVRRLERANASYRRSLGQ